MQNKVRADFIYLHCAAKEFKFNPQKFTIKIEIDTEKDKLGCDRRKKQNKKKTGKSLNSKMNVDFTARKTQDPIPHRET